jgi:hypothetical protein
MGLEGPWLNTTSTKKKTEKFSKAKQQEYEEGWRERNKRLKGMNLPKETFEQYIGFVYGRKTETKEKDSGKVKGYSNGTGKTGKKTYTTSKDVPQYRDTGIYVHSLKSDHKGACSSKASPMYTGTNIIGIAQMPKSNAVPVFNSDAIIDIARMKR